jgi:hypothetical protein
MFDDLLENNDFDVTNIDTTLNKPNYNSNNSNNNQSNNNKSKFFKKKEETIEDPYIPVAIYLDREFPIEAKTSLYNIASKLIAKGITIRINGDDKEFTEKIMSLSSKHVEVYLPWKNFNEIDSKYYFNSLTSKYLANKHFQGWEKVSDPVKSILARNIRMIFGNKNNSISLCLITWSKDGANKISEITKETGKSSFIIKVANFYGFPVINISKPSAENILEKTFNI